MVRVKFGSRLTSMVESHALCASRMCTTFVIPALKMNLFSLDRLQEHKHVVHLDNSGSRVTTRLGELLCKGTRPHCAHLLGREASALSSPRHCRRLESCELQCAQPATVASIQLHRVQLVSQTSQPKCSPRCRTRLRLGYRCQQPSRKQ